MIHRIESPLQIPGLMVLADLVPDVPRDVLRSRLLEAISKQNARVYVNKKGIDVTAFILATLEEFEGEDAVFVQFCASLPIKDNSSIVKEMVSRVTKWGGSLGLKKIYFMTRRGQGIRAFGKKYKFRVHATVMVSDIPSVYQKDIQLREAG